MTKPKVAFVNQPWEEVIPPVEAGSLTIWVYQVSKRCKADYDIAVYARNAGNQPAAETVDGILYKRIDVESEEKRIKLLKGAERALGYPRRKLPLYASGLFYAHYAQRIAADIQREGCDIVHVLNFSQYVPIIRVRNPAAKIVLHMQCEWLTQLDPTVIERRLQQTDLVIGVSDYITNKIRARFPAHAAKCCTVYNAADFAQYGQPYAGEEVGTRSEKRLLFVGRVSPEKGVHVLLDAFRQVARQDPHLRLDIVGHVASAPYEFMVLVSDDRHVSELATFYDRTLRRSDYGAHLRKRIPPELADRVAFVGQVSHSKTVDFYRRADLLINPSLTESFGMTLVEAMAAGTPVVATRVGGMVEIIEQCGGGRLVEPADADALATAILDLLSDPEAHRALSQSGAAAVQAAFSWERIAADLAAQYQRLCTPRLKAHSLHHDASEVVDDETIAVPSL